MKRKKIIATIPLSSMADIAFLLIVFFMATSVLKMDADIQLELPEGRGQELSEDNIPIYIDKNKNYYFENTLVSKQELLVKIQAVYVQKPSIRIIINADSELPYEILEDLFENLKELNITNIGIVTKQTERKM